MHAVGGQAEQDCEIGLPLLYRFGLGRQQAGEAQTALSSGPAALLPGLNSEDAGGEQEDHERRCGGA